jgi:GNAT superfamily N-acetyltransferase
MRFLAATADDWPWAWALQHAAFELLVARTHGEWTPELERACADAWAPGDTRIIEVEGARVGWARLERRADRDWLDLVVIDPARQGAGLGAAVLRALQAESAARGVPLWLSVWRVNRARALYARLGFHEVPRDERRVFMGWPSAEAPPG